MHQFKVTGARIEKNDQITKYYWLFFNKFRPIEVGVADGFRLSMGKDAEVDTAEVVMRSHPLRAFNE